MVHVDPVTLQALISVVNALSRYGDAHGNPEAAALINANGQVDILVGGEFAEINITLVDFLKALGLYKAGD